MIFSMMSKIFVLVVLNLPMFVKTCQGGVITREVIEKHHEPNEHPWIVNITRQNEDSSG